MGLFSDKARPIVSSRVEFARARADIQERMRSAELWGYTLAFVAFPLVLVGAVGAVDPTGTRYVWLTATAMVLVFGAPLGAVAVVPAYVRWLRARTVMRCVHCGAPLLGLVWQTGRCPDCGHRLFEVPPPNVPRS